MSNVLGILAVISFFFAPCYECLLSQWDLQATIRKMPMGIQKIMDKIWLYLFGDETRAEFPEKSSSQKDDKTNCKKPVEVKLDCSYYIFRKLVELKQGYQRCRISRKSYSVSNFKTTSPHELSETVFNVPDKPVNNGFCNVPHPDNSSTGEDGTSTKTEPNQNST